MNHNDNEVSLADNIAMLLGGGLVLLGTAVLGFINLWIGSPYAMPVTDSAGKVIAEPTFSVELRATIIALGLVVIAVYTVYKLVAGMARPAAVPTRGREAPAREAATTSDTRTSH